LIYFWVDARSQDPGTDVQNTARELLLNKANRLDREARDGAGEAAAQAVGHGVEARDQLLIAHQNCCNQRALAFGGANEMTMTGYCWESGPLTEDGCSTTCMLLGGHAGDHAWCRDDQIIIQFTDTGETITNRQARAAYDAWKER
jgi:hypothetical protein